MENQTKNSETSPRTTLRAAMELAEMREVASGEVKPVLLPLEDAKRIYGELTAAEVCFDEAESLRAGGAVTKHFREQLWKGLQAVAPWSESNDMDWEDEILCGLQLAIQAKQDLQASEVDYRKRWVDAERAVELQAKWHEAVIDALVVAGIYVMEHDDDPRLALRDLISWHVAVALDPRVSEDAAELVKRGGEAVPKLNEELRLEGIRADMAEAKLEEALKGWNEATRKLEWIERNCTHAGNAERYFPVKLAWGKAKGGRTLGQELERWMNPAKMKR